MLQIQSMVLLLACNHRHHSGGWWHYPRDREYVRRDKKSSVSYMLWCHFARLSRTYRHTLSTSQSRSTRGTQCLLEERKYLGAFWGILLQRRSRWSCGGGDNIRRSLQHKIDKGQMDGRGSRTRIYIKGR